MKNKKKIFFVIFLLFSIGIFTKTSVKLNDLRYFAYKDYTRFVLDLSAPIEIREKKLPGKGDFRLYFDLKNCSFDKNYPNSKTKEIIFNTGHLKRIRIGKRGGATIRVVFDFTKVGRYNLFYLKSPYRIVFDFFKESRINKKLKNEITISKPPKSIDGKYSIARQLGLGVRRIIIDPGHGGKDPGTINTRKRLFEKNIVLDVAKRLKKKFRKLKKFDVILTRNTDSYLTLEERTAIANSKKGDIFISIHINSSPKKKVHGIETYYLSMTTDPNAIRVAAQENAVSGNSIAELGNIVEKIIKNTKKSESKILASIVQKELIKKISSKYKRIKNLGVKKAPFYVLIGAEMPSILVEASFLSNRVESERLNRSYYRQVIAEGIYQGIIKYIKTLGKI